ncbi:MAG: type II toxin-antitoxin system HicA family toxin [Planctomycetales bacterium]|nr:type II toxin-antitoxin system HicA family toxin [Planctomycetales bacterium]
MKRRDLIRHLVNHGCELVRESGNHSWWGNPANERRSAVPRHTEVSNMLARKICREFPIRNKTSVFRRQRNGDGASTSAQANSIRVFHSA